MEWISIKNLLPADGVLVIVGWEGTGVVSVGVYSHVKKAWFNPMKNNTLPTPTHWQSFPII